MPTLLALLLAACGGTAPMTTPQLEGTSWQLVRIEAAGMEFLPRNPENYLLRFRMEQRLQLEADCNQAGATWRQDSGELRISELVTTRKLCSPPSLFNRYIMNLGEVERFYQRGNRLFLITAYEAATLEFEPFVFSPLAR